MEPEVQEVPLVANLSEVQEVPVAAPVVVLDTDDEARAAAAVAPPRDDALEDLEKALENACETIASLSDNVRNFTYEAQDLLYAKVNEFVNDLRQVDDKAKGVSAVIPFDVIEAIDKGRNPEQCTYQMLESCAEANNVSRGKLQAMRNFRDALDKAMAEPEEDPLPGEKGEAEAAKSAAITAGLLRSSVLQSVPAGHGTTNGF